MIYTSTGSRASVTPRKTASQQEDTFKLTSSPRTLIQSLKLEQSFENKENLSNNVGQADANESASSEPVSARSDASKRMSARSDGFQTMSARSDGSKTLSARSDRSESSGGLQEVDDERRGAGIDGGGDGLEKSRPGRKTPTDLLVEEIMGEGEILSPFASGKCFTTEFLTP